MHYAVALCSGSIQIGEEKHGVQPEAVVASCHAARQTYLLRMKQNHVY